MKNQNPISVATLKRLPMYLFYLRELPKDSSVYISATAISAALSLNEVQVRKDLAAVGKGGKPKIGYLTEELISDIEECIGCNEFNNAALVGAGNLGKALLCCEDFEQCGLNITVVFDKDKDNIGTVVNNRHILSADKLEEICNRIKINIGIITVPSHEAQEVCDKLVSCGAVAIWNFAPVKLNVPEKVMVLNEYIGSSLPLLLNHIADNT